MSVEVIDGQLHVTGNVTVGGKVTCAGATVAGDMDVEGAFSAQVGVTPFKGLFASVESLEEAYPKGAAGDYAYVGDALPARLYRWDGTEWRDTGNYGGDGGEIDLADYWRKTDGKVIAAIDISGGFAVLDTYNQLSGSAGIYRLTSSGGSYTYGYMMVMCDVAMRSVQQWVFGKFAVTGGTLAIAQQEMHSVCVRSYLYPAAGGQGQAGWTGWSYLSGDPAGGIDALKASVDDLQARTLGGGAIDISAGFAVLDTYNAFARCGIYRLKLNDVVASGYLLVTSDNMGHTIDQWLVGNYVIGTDGSVSGSHNDGMYSVCCRSYGLFSSVVPAGQWTAWTYAVKADPLRPSAAAYLAVVQWSGETVAGAAVTTQSVQGVEGTVVYDTTRRTFLLRVATTLPVKYYNNWGGREALQANAWQASNFTAGFFANTIYRGADGSVWVATADDTIEAVSTPPDTSPYVLPQALNIKTWDTSLLPDKTELIDAWEAGRAIRLDDGSRVDFLANSTRQAAVFTVWAQNFMVGTVTYHGTATEWGTASYPWTLSQLATTAAQDTQGTQPES